MRTKQGIVVSAKNDKTIVVRVDRHIPHPKYGKRYRVSKKFHAHDEKNEANEGDLVEIAESRPSSKLKRWSLKKIISQGTQTVISQPAAVKSEEETELNKVAQVEKEAPQIQAKPDEEKGEKSEEIKKDSENVKEESEEKKAEEKPEDKAEIKEEEKTTE